MTRKQFLVAVWKIEAHDTMKISSKQNTQIKVANNFRLKIFFFCFLSALFNDVLNC